MCVAAAALVILLVAACGSSSKSGSGTTTAPATTKPAATTASKPAATPPPPPAPSITVEFDKKYGTFAATTHSGTSDGVVPIPGAAKAGLVTAAYSGSSNFVIGTLDAQNTSTELLVNTIGAYSGTTAFGFGLSSSQSVNLKVTASGPWTVKIAPISTAPKLTSPASGKGDAVYLWDGKATTWTITNDGQGNFVVTTHGSGLFGDDLLVNEIGAYHGSVPVTAGPAVTTIQSDGTWRITFGTITPESPPAVAGSANPPAAAAEATPPAATPAATPPAATAAASPPPAQPTPNAVFKFCDSNVEARANTTSCEFAENVFYEFYKASPQREFPVYSPVTRMEYQMHCTGESLVTCSGGTNAGVRFPMSAVRAYTQADANAYANSHDIGPPGVP
jgi:hypothetical protein